MITHLCNTYVYIYIWSSIIKPYNNKKMYTHGYNGTCILCIKIDAYIYIYINIQNHFLYIHINIHTQNIYKIQVIKC